MTPNNTPRNDSIDLLKIIGLSLIILAHVSPPYIIFQVRNFDVPMMVVASGMAFAVTREKGHAPKYFEYILQRSIRLIGPVWVFLTIYFLSKFVTNNEKDIGIQKIIESYLLLGGIGYVWIIRVFLLIAIISPIIFQIAKNYSPLKIYSLSAAVVILIEIWNYSITPINQPALKAIELTVIYAAGYSVCFIVGIIFYSLSKDVIQKLLISILILFLISACIEYNQTGIWLDIQSSKYPPRSLYLAYAILMTTFIYLNSTKIINCLSIIKSDKIFSFIARNTIWIYLWHIAFLDIVTANHFLIKYILVLWLSIIFTYIQVKTVKRIASSEILPRALRDFLPKILTG